MTLFGTELDRKAEDSLENTLSCVPKVQGDEPNLSGKRTEMLAMQAFFVLGSPFMGLSFLYVNIFR